MRKVREIGLRAAACPQKLSQHPCPLAGEISVCHWSLTERANKHIRTNTHSEKIYSAVYTLRQQAGREFNDAAGERQLQNDPEVSSPILTR